MYLICKPSCGVYNEVCSVTLTPVIITPLARGSLGLWVHFKERLEIHLVIEYDDL